MDQSGTEIVQPGQITSDTAREAFKNLGVKVDVTRLENAVKAYQWFQQTGASGIAVADIMEDKEFWVRITKKYDPVALDEYPEDGKGLKPKDLMEYLRFRLEISNLILSANKELVRLAAPNTTGPHKRGVKAAVSAVTTINPLSGRA